MDENRFTFEQRIVNHLMLNNNSFFDLSLLHGKMGIALFFFNYGELKKNDVYRCFGENLLDDVWKNIYKVSSIDFDYGMCGIAWGIEYLIQNKFVSGDSNIVCQEIDDLIFHYDLRRINYSFDFEGLLHYVLMRISGSVKQNNSLPFDDMYLKDLLNCAFLLNRTQNLSNLCNDMVLMLLEFVEDKKEINYAVDLSLFIDNVKINNQVDDFMLCPIGLKEGLTGMLYKQLFDK